jgi:hypothetical protein
MPPRTGPGSRGPLESARSARHRQGSTGGHALTSIESRSRSSTEVGHLHRGERTVFGFAPRGWRREI